MGPDVPVYLWWGRVAAEQGVDVVAERPGAAVLLPAVAGALGTGDVAAQAGVQYALAIAIGLAGAGLAAVGRPRRSTWLLAGLLTGLFATFLAAGYVANLAMAASYLAAATALAHGSRRGLAASIGLLAAAGLAHPPFLLAGLAVLVVSAAWSWGTGHPSSAARALRAVVGGGLLATVGLVVARIGGPAIVADTSKDALFRRLGREEMLLRLYRARFAQNWGRYAPWALLPLATIGVAASSLDREDPEPGNRLLMAWVAVTLVGIPVALITGWFPADRVVTFAYCLPILAAFGAVRLANARRYRVLARMAATLGVAAIAFGTVNAWGEQRVFVKRPVLDQLVAAARVAATTEPGTPLVFVVHDEGEPPFFLMTNTGNLARAAVPAARAADVRVHLGLLADAPTEGGAAFVLPAVYTTLSTPDDPTLHRWPGGVLATVPDPRPLPPMPDELRPSSPAAIAATTVAAIALFTLLGHGWSQWALRGAGAAAWASAAAFGAGALILAAFVVDRAGVGLSGRLGPLLASALAGGGGYALAFRQRRRELDPGVGERKAIEDQVPEVP